MARLGRKPKYQKNFHPEDFVKQSSQGKTFAQIAKEWKIDRDTIKEWRKQYPEFSAAVKIGRQLAEAWYIDLGHKAMLNKVTIDGKPVKVELGWYVWMTKNMFGWSDRASHELSGPDGKPIETLNRSELSDEQLDAKINKLLTKGENNG